MSILLVNLLQGILTFCVKIVLNDLKAADIARIKRHSPCHNTFHSANENGIKIMHYLKCLK